MATVHNSLHELIASVRKQLDSVDERAGTDYTFTSETYSGLFWFRCNDGVIEMKYVEVETVNEVTTMFDEQAFISLPKEERADIVEGFILFAEKALFEKLNKGE